jgi:hypothetical protein
LVGPASIIIRKVMHASPAAAALSRRKRAVVRNAGGRPNALRGRAKRLRAAVTSSRWRLGKRRGQVVFVDLRTRVGLAPWHARRRNCIEFAIAAMQRLTTDQAGCVRFRTPLRGNVRPRLPEMLNGAAQAVHAAPTAAQQTHGLSRGQANRQADRRWHGDALILQVGVDRLTQTNG